MNEIIRDSLKTGLMFALIGAAVAVAAPFLLSSILGAETVGALGTITGAGVLHTTLIFGGFGILDPIVKAGFNFLFGNDKPKDTATSLAKEKSETKQVNINIQQAPQQAQGQAIVDTKFRQNIDAERIAALLGGNRTPSA